MFNYKSNSTEMSSVLAVFVSVAIILGPIISKFVLSEKTDYLILYLLTFGMTIISLVLSIFIKEEKFNYDIQVKNIDTSEEKDSMFLNIDNKEKITYN